jgi:iron complex outermembrane receptor protein
MRAGVILCLLLTFTTLSADELPSGDEPADIPEMEYVLVTGTRIKRADTEGLLPVTVFDKAMIDLSGETSLADFVRNLSFNTWGSGRSMSATGDIGTAQVSLRGLGPSRSLVLVDGRRLPKAPIATSFQDLNTIPVGSVERIEVLSDGASAIYGSDAIAGVINIITRDDYDGWELMYGHGEPAAGGDRDYGSLLFGASGQRWNVVASYSFNDQAASYQSDYDFYEPAEGFWTLWSNNFTTLDPSTYQHLWNFTAIPGGCAGSDAFVLAQDPWSLSGEVCSYDFNRVETLETSIDTDGVLLKGEYELNERWTLWANASWSETEAGSRLGPFVASNLFFGLPPLSPDSPNNPTNPASALHDPAFGPNVPVFYWHAFSEVGLQDETTTTTLEDLQIGASGSLGTVELDFGIRTTDNETEDVTDNIVPLEAVHGLIADGSYNLAHPGANPGLLDSIGQTSRLHWRYDQDEVFATASWSMFELGGMPVHWVLGGEYREERSVFRPPATGFYGESRDIERDATAVYFESLLPFGPDVELSLAGRYDDYSDWGDNFSPKISMRWRALEQLVLRASYGEGFRAPELSVMAFGAREGWDVTIDDPVTCKVVGQPPECEVWFWGTQTVSSDLDAEQSDNWSFGLVWEPASRFEIALDYYDIEVSDQIYFFGPGQVVDMERWGETLPAGLGITRDPESGVLLSVTSGWGNHVFVETSGLDLSASYDFEAGPGRWHSNLQASYVLDMSSAGEIDWAGLSGRPELRATLSNHYELDSFTFAWNVNFISSQDWDPAFGITNGALEGDVPSWTTHDLQASWRTPWNGRLSLGARNAFDEQPKLDVGSTRGYRYNTHLYDAFGRIIYAEITQAF